VHMHTMALSPPLAMPSSTARVRCRSNIFNALLVYIVLLCVSHRHDCSAFPTPHAHTSSRHFLSLHPGNCQRTVSYAYPARARHQSVASERSSVVEFKSLGFLKRLFMRRKDQGQLRSASETAYRDPITDNTKAVNKFWRSAVHELKSNLRKNVPPPISLTQQSNQLLRQKHQSTTSC
jgi:hypothetical protein